MSTEHENLRELVHAYVDGELDLAKAGEVQRHLQSCAECRTTEQAIRELSGALTREPAGYRAPARLRKNVRAALMLVSRGEAPFGIVYRTDALADKGVKVVDTFPPDTYAPIVYPAALLAASRSPAAKALFEHLRSPEARPVWERYGFGIAQ